MNIKPILRAKVLNSYRSHTPYKFYSPIKGHSGIDLDYRHEDLPSPVTGRIVGIRSGSLMQVEMGNTLYVEDLLGNIHVFAHLSEIYKKWGDKIARNEIIAKTGNTGKRTTAPHLHWEIITYRPRALIDRIMRRKLLNFTGYNTHPIIYLKNLYYKYSVDLDGNPITNI